MATRSVRASGESSSPAAEGDARVGAERLSPRALEHFHELYRQHFDFVFRNLRRLGVEARDVDDAVQDVFMVVLRQIDKYQAESHGKAWLFAIALRVARNRRRSLLRKGGHVSLDEFDLQDTLGDEESPYKRAVSAQAARLLHAFLESIDEDKRSVFVMTELEQMSAPEIAGVLQVNLNTVYARIRAARREFARLVEQHSQREAADGER